MIPAVAAPGDHGLKNLLRVVMRQRECNVLQYPFGIDFFAYLKVAEAVETTPDQLVRDDDKESHHNDAANDEGGVSLFSHFRNESAQAFSLERRLAPHGNFGNDAGVPGSTRRGAGPGHPERKDGRKN